MSGGAKQPLLTSRSECSMRATDFCVNDSELSVGDQCIATPKRIPINIGMTRFEREERIVEGAREVGFGEGVGGAVAKGVSGQGATL